MTRTLENATDDTAHWNQRREQWIDTVRRLVDEIAAWSEAEGWAVQRDQKKLREELLGEYNVPALIVSMPGGELSVNPIGFHVIGAEGRVDLDAFPTLSRVKLVLAPEGWRIITDSNVPIRSPWNRDTFVQLAHDLLA